MIWGGQVKAVNELLAEIKDRGTTRPIEHKIAPMNDIFELQNVPKMKADEESFLRTGREKMIAVIPAAGNHLEEYSMKSISMDIPIAMLDINGKALVRRQSEVLRRAGISEIYVIGGYKKELIDVEGVKVLDNIHYEKTGILHSIMYARSFMKERVLIVYGDILFDETVVDRLLRSEEDITLLVDSTFDSKQYGPEKIVDLVISDRRPVKSRRKLHDLSLRKVVRIGSRIDPSQAHYEFPGLMFLSPRGLTVFKEIYLDGKERYRAKPYHDAAAFDKAGLADILQEIVDSGFPVHCLEVESGWIEIHSMDNYKLACTMVN